MRGCYVSILIDLEWIVRRDAPFSCKWKLCDDICNFALCERQMPRLLRFWTPLLKLRRFWLFRRLWLGTIRSSLCLWFNSWFDLVIVIIYSFCLFGWLWIVDFCLEFLTSGHWSLRVFCLFLNSLKTLCNNLLLSSMGSICWIQRFRGLLSSSLAPWLYSLLPIAELSVWVESLSRAHRSV